MRISDWSSDVCSSDLSSDTMRLRMASYAWRTPVPFAPRGGFRLAVGPELDWRGGMERSPGVSTRYRRILSTQGAPEESSFAAPCWPARREAHALPGLGTGAAATRGGRRDDTSLPPKRYNHT